MASAAGYHRVPYSMSYNGQGMAALALFEVALDEGR